MNNLNYVTIGVLGTVLALGACTANPDATKLLNTSTIEYKQEKVEAATSTIPKWFKTLPTDEKAIYSVGTAQSPDMQMSVDMATLNAKYTLADRINGKLDGMMKTFMTRLGTDDDVSATTMSEVEKVTKNVIASVDVAGYNPKEIEVYPTGTQFRAFVLLEYSEDEARKIIMNRMMKDRMVYGKIRSTNAWKELENEVNASKTEDEVTSMSNIETEINKVVQ
jgi:HSP20 family molecular chaperone IbpA